MPPAPLPPNEPQRLASVRALAELGQAHRATQAVLALLREQIGAGRAFLNIVDETTQHPFLRDPNGPESSSRDAAFCGHVVHRGAPLIVPDASSDERFSDSPFVTSGEIGFYYGAPVFTPEGHAAGALCVHGPGPRIPRAHEIPLLTRLADLVTEELRRARRFAEVESNFRVHAEQLRLMVEHTPAPVAMFDTAMRYVAASKMWCGRWNADPASVRGVSYYESCPWLPERMRDLHRRCLAGETLSRDEDRIEWPDGRVSVVKWRLVPWYTRASEIGGMIVFSEDITEAVEARARVERSNERLRLALESANAGLWDWDVRGDRVHRDALWWQVHGHAPGSLGDDGPGGWALVHPDDHDALRGMIASLIDGERDRAGCEARVADAGGRHRWFEINAFAAHRDERGRATRVVGLNLSIDDRKRLEAEREAHVRALAAAKQSLEEHALRLAASNLEAREARAAAEAANEAKSRFLANMSHEIRTPISAILGFAEVVGDHGVDERTRADAVSTIRRNGEHLLTLINDILDLSKIEADKLTTERVRSDPGVMIREAVRSVALRAEAKGLSVDLDVAGDLPEEIATDPTRLRQVLINLLDNAVKFTEKGSVSVHASRGDGSRLVFEIRDTGIGMTPETAARMFEPFAQADGSTTRRYGGTGLGLTISARLATLLGGRLEVARTAPGQGTTMRLTIDAGAAPARAPAVAEREPAPRRGGARPLEGVRVLLAEDGPDNQRLFDFMLSRAGASVLIVGDGRQAFDAVCERGEGAFDLLLLDMQMPEMDGYETAAALRARGVTLPIVALTANAMDGDRDRCLGAGCDDYVSKPVSANDLTRTCERWAVSRDGTGSGPHAETAGTEPGVTAGGPLGTADAPGGSANRPAA